MTKSDIKSMKHWSSQALKVFFIERIETLNFITDPALYQAHLYCTIEKLFLYRVVDYLLEKDQKRVYEYAAKKFEKHSALRETVVSFSEKKRMTKLNAAILDYERRFLKKHPQTSFSFLKVSYKKRSKEIFVDAMLQGLQSDMTFATNAQRKSKLCVSFIEKMRKFKNIDLFNRKLYSKLLEVFTTHPEYKKHFLSLYQQKENKTVMNGFSNLIEEYERQEAGKKSCLA